MGYSKLIKRIIDKNIHVQSISVVLFNIDKKMCFREKLFFERNGLYFFLETHRCHFSVNSYASSRRGVKSISIINSRSLSFIISASKVQFRMKNLDSGPATKDKMMRKISEAKSLVWCCNVLKPSCWRQRLCEGDCPNTLSKQKFDGIVFFLLLVIGIWQRLLRSAGRIWISAEFNWSQ